MKFQHAYNGFVLDIELEVSAHERIGIVGPNGSGKSTLLSRWRAQDSSSVLLEQGGSCFPHMTVTENIRLGAVARGMSKKGALVRANELLAHVGMSELGANYPAELSGGQEQKVALLRALATGARALILDEPLAGLDTPSQREFRADLNKVEQCDQLIIATHDPLDLLALTDRVVVLDGGRLVADMLTHDLFLTPPNDFVAELVDCNRVVTTDVVWFHPQDVRFGSGADGFNSAGTVHSIEVAPHRTRIGISLSGPDSHSIVAEIEGSSTLNVGEVCQISVNEQNLRRSPLQNHVRAASESTS